MTVKPVRHTRPRHSLRGRHNALTIAAFPLLLAVLGAEDFIAPGTAQAQTAAPVALAPAGVKPIDIEDVVNVIGFDQLRHGSDGRLAFHDGNLVLSADKATGTIPLAAIRLFTIERSTTALMRGTEGKIIGFIPRGVGNLYHAIRRGAYTLTIYYADKNEAVHGAVLILPKSRKDDVLSAFASAGLSPTAPVSTLPVSPPLATLPIDLALPSASVRPVVAEVSLPGTKPSVSIMLPDSSGQALPAAYQAAIYEQLNSELVKSGLFGTVWRHGDSRAPTDGLTLSVRIKGFKKGNPGLRGGIPIFGMLVGKTLIKAEVTLTAPSGTVLLQRQVKGSKRMSGESIAAAESLARRVSQSIRKAPGFASKKPGTEVAAR